MPPIDRTQKLFEALKTKILPIAPDLANQHTAETPGDDLSAVLERLIAACLNGSELVALICAHLLLTQRLPTHLKATYHPDALLQQFASRFHRDIRTVRRRLKVAETPLSVQLAWQDNRMTSAAVEQVARQSPAVQNEIAQAIDRDPFSARTIVDSLATSRNERRKQPYTWLTPLRRAAKCLPADEHLGRITCLSAEDLDAVKKLAQTCSRLANLPAAFPNGQDAASSLTNLFHIHLS
jgi:hypothetical protein